jgi:hypothetical protein
VIYNRVTRKVRILTVVMTDEYGLDVGQVNGSTVGVSIHDGGGSTEVRRYDVKTGRSTLSIQASGYYDDGLCLRAGGQ